MNKVKIISKEAGLGFAEYLNPIRMVSAILKNGRLLRQFIWWEVNDRYRGSALGMLWTIIVPLLRLTVYTFVFSILLGGRSIIWKMDSNFVVGEMIFCGVVLFNVFSESVGKASRLMWINKTYVKNIVFPLEIIPVTVVGVSVVNSFFGMAVLIALELLINGNLQWTLIYLPLAYLPIIFFVAGASWILATLGIFSRDVDNLMQSLIQLLFFLSGVIFPLERLMNLVPDPWDVLLRLNILSTAINDARRIIFDGMPPDWFWLKVDLGFSFCLMLVGYAFFMSNKKDFADVV